MNLISKILRPIAKSSDTKKKRWHKQLFAFAKLLDSYCKLIMRIEIYKTWSIGYWPSQLKYAPTSTPNKEPPFVFVY